jgi:hypothetical protein
MTVKLMRTAMPLVMTACLVMTAGAALTSLPNSSHYSGISYYAASPSSGLIQTGRVEFAVYDTQTNPNEFVGTDNFTAPGAGRYVYAYQIFNYATNDYGMTNTSVPFFVIESLGVNAIASNNDIGTINDATGGVDATSYSLTTNTSTTDTITTVNTSVVFAFDNGILAAGENSWYLIISSDQDWVKGSYSLEAPETSDIPQPDGTTENTNADSESTTAPEPASLLLMGLGVAVLVKRKDKSN